MPFFTQHIHMTSNPVSGILFKRPPMPFTVMMARFLSPVLSAQFMTLLPTLIVNLASSWSSSWSLSWSSSCPSPRLQLAMLLSPAVGPLFPAVVALFYPLWVLRCWCCCGLLFVLDCPDLCPLHVLTHVLITARSHTCCAITFPAKRRTTRLAIGYASLNLRTLSHVLRVVWETPAPL